MNKELEAIEEIGNIDLGDNPYKTFERNKLKNVYNNEFNTIKQALQRLEAIENASPTEALECVGRIEKYISDRNMYEDLKLGSDMYYNALCIIRQALINFNNLTKQINDASGKSAIGLLNKINKLDSYTYNNILEALLKTQNLEREKVEYKRVLRIVFKKNVDIDFLKSATTFDEYNKLIKFKAPFALELTEEEFDLVKRLVDTMNI